MADEQGREPLRVVAVSGTLHRPAKTGLLVDAILSALREAASADSHAVEAHTVELLDHAGALAASLAPGGQGGPALADAFERVATADILVVATPVYKGSYTGLLKLFVDFLGQDSLAGRPVLLAATGGSAAHSLVIEHELRPLFAFFRADTLPVGVYATGADFADGAVASDTLLETIRTAAVAAVARVAGVTGVAG
jgi:FMN reductase